MTSLTAGRRQSRNLLTGGLDRARCARIQPPPAVVALTLLAALLRFWRLGAQGLWYDESYTLMLVRHPLGQMLGIIPHTESTPPVYYCVAWAWVRVFGRGAAGLRSLSAAAGTALVPLAYASARDLLRSRRAGVVCAALLACNPLLWWYSQEARAYELLACLCALSLWAFARGLHRPGRGALAVWAGSSALALGTHYFAGMLVIPEAAWLLIVHRRSGRAWLSVAFVAACGLALLPLLLAQAGANHDSWIAHSSLSLRIAQIGPQLILGTGTPWRANSCLPWYSRRSMTFCTLMISRAGRRAGASPCQRRPPRG
jgi:4-amino-4-deoxy-L-arabinose transferase-like glycosyltransferase